MPDQGRAACVFSVLGIFQELSDTAVISFIARGAQRPPLLADAIDWPPSNASVSDLEPLRAGRLPAEGVGLGT
jgi:hypothetical protein